MNFLNIYKKYFSVKRAFSLLLLALLLMAGCAAAPVRDWDDEEANDAQVRGETIRVEVLKDISTVEIEVEGSGYSTIVEAAPYSRMLVDGKEVYGAYLVEGEGSIIHIGAHSYKGSVEVERSGGGLHVINEVPLETYLVGLINKEISSTWHPEILKTQAVIARTYALFQKAKREGEPFHLSSTTADQVYGGAGSEDSVALRAVWETSGEVLTFEGELALTLYHANAGGITEPARNVWGGDYSYLVSVKSPEDRRDPRYEWELKLKADELGALLEAKGFGVGKVRKVKVKKKLRSGRVTELLVGGKRGSKTLTGEEMRAVLGYSKLRSTLFKVKKRGRTFTFSGTGSGHGVGLSQWGARGMADDGSSYKKILRHYYPGTTLERIY